MKNIQLVVCLSGLMFAGCATLITDTTQPVSFDSEPRGAEVWVEGRLLGLTPFSANVKRKQTQQFNIRKYGYRLQTREMSTRISSAFWGNIALGYVYFAPFYSTTDSVLGNIYQFSPGSYYVVLAKESEDVPLSSSKRSRVKDFIFSSYDNLIRDINKAEGNYLNSLLSLLEVKDAGRDSAVEKLNALAAEHSVIPDFAESVLREFR